MMKALRSKRREVFLSILGSCYTTLDAILFEDAATLLPGFFICIWLTQKLRSKAKLLWKWKNPQNTTQR